MNAASRLIGALFVPIILSGTDKPQVTYVPKDKVDAAFSKGAPLVVGEKYRVQASHRDGPGQVEVHHLDTDVMYIVEGSATFVTGGTVVGGKATEPKRDPRRVRQRRASAPCLERRRDRHSQ